MLRDYPYERTLATVPRTVLTVRNIRIESLVVGIVRESPGSADVPLREILIITDMSAFAIFTTCVRLFMPKKK
jgi:hypothetical protein